MANIIPTEFPKNKLERFIAYYHQAKDYSESWRLKAKDDYGFVEGDKQWKTIDKQEMARTGRPALIMNTTLPIINLISGQERASRLGISYKPRGLDDDRLAMIANSSFKYLEDTSELIYETSNAFTDMLITGRGYLYSYVDYSDIDEPLGEIIFKRIHPFSVFYDPSSNRYDLSDAKYIIYTRWIDENELRLIFPRSMEMVRPGEWLTMSANLLGEKVVESDWRNTRKGQVRLMEIWYREPKTMFAVITSEGNVELFDTEKEAKNAVDFVVSIARQNNAPVPDIDIVNHIVYQTRVADFTLWKILRDRPSPYKHNRYPFVPFTAYNFDEHIMGVVRSLKDPQREKNKRWSQMLHMINTMAKSVWAIPKKSVSEKQLMTWSTDASKPGFWFEYNPQVGIPQPIPTQNIPGSFVQLMQIAEDEMRKISGAIQELLGLPRAPDQSGKALGILQKSGATILAPLFDQLVRSQKITGRLAIKLIQQYYTPEKVLEVIGASDRMRLSETETDVISFIERTANVKFDTVVDITPLIGSERERQFNQVLQSIKVGLPPSPTLLEILLSVSDFPNKEKYLAELRSAGQQQSGQFAGQ